MARLFRKHDTLAARRLAGVSTTDIESVAQVGDHVMTTDGPGMVANVYDGPYGDVSFEIFLDDDRGNGEYRSSDVIGVIDKTAKRYSQVPMACDDCGCPAESSTAGGPSGHKMLCDDCRGKRGKTPRKTAGRTRFSDFQRGQRVVVKNHPNEPGTVVRLHGQGNAYTAGYVHISFDNDPERIAEYPWRDVIIIIDDGKTGKTAGRWKREAPGFYTAETAKGRYEINRVEYPVPGRASESWWIVQYPNKNVSDTAFTLAEARGWAEADMDDGDAGDSFPVEGRKSAAVDENRQQYNKGWAAYQRCSDPANAIEAADRRGASSAWYIGFMDAESNYEKYTGLPTTTASFITVDEARTEGQKFEQRGAVERTAARAPLPLLSPVEAQQAGFNVASVDYPQLGEILWERPDWVEAEPAPGMLRRLTLSKKAAKEEPEWLKDRPKSNPIKDSLTDKNQPWWWRKMVGPMFDRYNDSVPEGRKVNTEEDLRRIPSHDWCRFRESDDCFFPKDFDEQGSQQAGYPVWIPFHRGECPWKTAQAQKHECKVSEPGPHSGERTVYPQATESWSQGGQRKGSITPVTISPRREAGWADIREKAKRIRSSGGVHIISALTNVVTGEIRGDTGLYVATVTLVPGSRQVAISSCSCPWETYRWARSGPWKPLEGRACAHVTALLYEMQARKMFGGEITEDVGQPGWRTEQPALEAPKSRPGAWRLDEPSVSRPGLDEYAAALQDHRIAVTAQLEALDARAARDPGLDSHVATLALALASLEVVESAVHEGVVPHEAVLVPLDCLKESALTDIASFYAQVSGRIVVVDGFDDDGHAWAEGRVLDRSQLMYPTFHPTLGLTAAKTAGKLSQESLISVAENVMENFGLVGRTFHQAEGHVDDPAYQAGMQPLRDYVMGIVDGWVNVHVSNYMLDKDHAQAMITGTGTMYVRESTSEMTVLHECAHLIARTDHSAQGHGDKFVEVLRGLYGKHLGATALAKFDDIYGAIEHTGAKTAMPDAHRGTSRLGVELWDNTHADSPFDPDGGRWTVFCTDHGMLINVETKDMGQYLQQHPDEFCEVHMYPDEWQNDGSGWMPKTAADDAPTGVMIALVPDIEIARQLIAATSVSGFVAEDIDQVHLTLSYIGKAADLDRADVHAAAQAVASLMQPMSGTVGGLGTFQHDDGKSVLWAAADVVGVDVARSMVTGALEALGITEKGDHGYTPHITLAYHDQPISQLPDITAIAGLPLHFSAIVVAYAGEWTHFTLNGSDGDIVAIEKRGAQTEFDAHVVVEYDEDAQTRNEPEFEAQQQWLDHAPGHHVEITKGLVNEDGVKLSVKMAGAENDLATPTMWGGEEVFNLNPIDPSTIKARVVAENGDQLVIHQTSNNKVALDPEIGVVNQMFMGVLAWYKDGEIAMVSVNERYQREGIATKMFDVARQINPAVHHSDVLSDAGKAWSKAVGASLHTAAQVGRFTLKRNKGGDRENISVDGVYLGWIYKDTRDGYWYVRTTAPSDHQRAFRFPSQVVVNGERTRADAMEALEWWMGRNGGDLLLDYLKEERDEWEKDFGPGSWGNLHEGSIDTEVEVPTSGFEYAGLVIKAIDSGRVLMTQRTPFHGDGENAYGKWEFPGGGVNEGETPLEGALREFSEETGLTLPDTWSIEGVAELDNYLSIAIIVPNEAWTTDAKLLDFETMGIGWFDPEHIEETDIARDEVVEDADWEMIKEASGGVESIRAAKIQPGDYIVVSHNVFDSDDIEDGMSLVPPSSKSQFPSTQSVTHYKRLPLRSPYINSIDWATVSTVEKTGGNIKVTFEDGRVMNVSPNAAGLRRTATIQSEASATSYTMVMGGPDNSFELHIAGCGDLNRPKYQLTNKDSFQAASLIEALDYVIDDQMISQGYSQTDVKVFACAKSGIPVASAPVDSDACPSSGQAIDNPRRMLYMKCPSCSKRLGTGRGSWPKHKAWVSKGSIQSEADAESILHDEPQPALPESYGMLGDGIMDPDGFYGNPVVPSLDGRTTPDDPWVLDSGVDPSSSTFEPFVPGDHRLSWLSEGSPGDDNNDIAAAASAHLAKTALKDFSAAEQDALISEGEYAMVGARNIDRLDIAGTHYESSITDVSNDEVLW